VGELAENFSRKLGAPTKELYSMAGLVFLADFFGWTAEEAVHAYIFRSDVQYALNLQPGVTVCSRTVERYQKLFRDNELATQIFHDVTTRLAECWNSISPASGLTRPTSFLTWPASVAPS